jgi:vitamin B12 transporter
VRADGLHAPVRRRAPTVVRRAARLVPRVPRRHAPPPELLRRRGYEDVFQKTISLFAITVASPAFAQLPDDAAEVGNDAIVVTASRVTQEAREIGSSVSVVTAADIARNQITFVKDILQDLPGVLVDTDRPGDFTNVSIRGSDNDEVLWLVDGIELGDPSSTSTQFQADHLTSRDIARIEVLRGNQSSLYGSDAIGGVINVITRRATEEGLKVNAEAEGGSYGTLNGGASLLGKSGPLDVRVTATGYRHDGPSLADPRTANPVGSVSEKDEYWRYGLSGRAGYQASDALSFQAIGFWQNSFSDLDNTRSDSLNTVKKREYAFAGQGSYKGLDEKLKVDLTASRYVARRLYFGTSNREEGDLYRGTKDELSLNLAYGGDGPVSLAAGGNYEREKTNQGTRFSGDLFAKVNTKSAYGEVALRPVAGMTVTGAARIDDNSRFGSFDTYRGTFAYAFGPLKLRASYGTGAKAPGLYQLFDPTYGNPDLGVQKSRGGDVGFDLTMAEGLSMQASYFFGRKKNEINFDAGRPPFGGYTQYGRTRANGIEVGIGARPFAWLTISQTYTYTDHEVKDDRFVANHYVDSGRPKHSGTTSVTVTPVARASLTARMRYHDGDASSAYTPATGAYTIVDLLGAYAITERIEVYGRVVNLFDRWYQVGYGTQTLGRSAYGGVRVNF